MDLLTPHYFKKFSCIASACKDNCCYGGWQIGIDDETAQYYKNVTGEFGDRLRAALSYTDEYCFKLKDNCCPFLDCDNLCGIYKELGPEHMGVVCTQFPRFSEYFGGIKETGIGLACEEAARIILQDEETFHLERTELAEEEYRDSEFRPTLYQALSVARDKFFALLDDGGLSFARKLAIIIVAGELVQNNINDNAYEELISYVNGDGFIDNCDKLADEIIDASSGIPADDYEGMMGELWYAFDELDPLNDDWTEVKNGIFASLHNEEASDCAERYCRLSDDFKADFMANNPQYEHWCNNILKYYIFRYFLKATYDCNAYGKIQLAVANILAMRDINIMQYSENGKFTEKDMFDAVHIFSREVEYSEDNLEVLSEEFVFGDVFEADNLIRLVARV